MNLEWCGTAALLLCEGNTCIAFDPFGGIPPEALHPETCDDSCAEKFRLASDVFVTHGHFDHILQIPSIYASTNTVIHATQTPLYTLMHREFPKSQLELIMPDRNYTAGCFEIATFRGRHCQFDFPLVLRTALRYLHPGNLGRGLKLLRLNREYPENREILFYEVTCGNRRLQIMGSMGLDPDVPYSTEADLLILPYQGKSHPEKYAASLVERLLPKAVLLDHYDNSFPPMTAQVDTSGIEKLLNEKYNIPCRAMRRGITYNIEEIDL